METVDGKTGVDVKLIAGVAPTLSDTTKIDVAVWGRVSTDADAMIGIESLTQRNMRVVIGKAGNLAGVSDTALDDLATNSIGLIVKSFGYTFNDDDSKFDRLRGNTEGTALALEADTTSTRTSADIPIYNGRSLTLAFMTANKVGSTATYTLSFRWKYDGTNYVTRWTAAAAITVNGTVIYEFGPGTTDADGDATESEQFNINRTLQVIVTVASADGSNNMDTSVFYAVGM